MTVTDRTLKVTVDVYTDRHHSWRSRLFFTRIIVTQSFVPGCPIWYIYIYITHSTYNIYNEYNTFRMPNTNHPKNYTRQFAFCCVLLWFDTCQYHPYPSGLLHWHWGNHMIAPVPVKQTWRIWVNKLHGVSRDDITKINTNRNKSACIFYGMYCTLWARYVMIILSLALGQIYKCLSVEKRPQKI